MPGFLRRNWLALSIALLSSFATPVVALAHGHAHAETAHDAPHALHHDGQPEWTSPDSDADHGHGTIAIGIKSFGPIVALPTAATARISWSALAPLVPGVAGDWTIPRSAEPPPNLTRAPPVSR